MAEYEMELELQLGDIIKITNPLNEILNEQTFIIDYIDNKKIYLINTDTLNRIKLPIDDKGILGDGNITLIEILSRASSPSYAIQNGLLTGNWVNIYFGGDYPVIITGEITNLENDMIEIQTPDKETLYINFDYKGLPENLPIDNIEIREKPSTLQAQLEAEATAVEDLEQEFEDLKGEQTMAKAEDIQITVPMNNIRNQLREFIVKADQIVFGDEELGPIVQYIDVSSKTHRYSIETQIADLLDDLLSTVPDAQRTPRVLNNIHITIERFKQLREKFSTFDQYGNVEGPVIKSATYKPLRNWLHNFNINLYWILPVVKNIKKIYNTEIDEENSDAVIVDFKNVFLSMDEILKNYQSNTLNNDTNKYAALYADLDPFFRPFNYIDDENQNNILIEKEVQSNINTIVNNLEDMYSTVFQNNNIRSRRFVISKYNLGQTKLDTIDAVAGKMTTIRIPITRGDVMSVGSIMTLPEPTIRFSKINLPGTDILSKANMNQIFLNYWQLLKNKTTVNNVFIDSMDTEIDFDENTFVSGIRNYVLNIPADQLKEYGSKLDVYNQFTNTMVPKTRVIFNLMKKYIKGKLSIVNVVSYLEPFLIYTDDLTFKQYQEIVQFIDTKISDYNKNMIELSRIFKSLSTIRSSQPIQYKAFSVVEIIDTTIRNQVFDSGYGISNNELQLSNTEMLCRLILKDKARLYTSAIAYQNLKLMYPKDIGAVFEMEMKNNEKKMIDANKNATCDTMIISKMYSSMEQLERDNNVLIFFDKKYDKTNYGIMEDMGGYAKEVSLLSVEKLKDYIINDQMKKNKLTETEATYLADTLIDGNKRVLDGQYALLYKGYSENIEDEIDYYVRKNNKWVLDNQIQKKEGITDQSSLLCDLQKKCMNVSTKANSTDESCESMQTNEISLQNALLNNVISEFDIKYKQSKEEFEKEITTQYEYFISIMPIVLKIDNHFLLKYNNQKFQLGLKTDDDDDDAVRIVSPFSNILNIILSQNDFAKKQNDIVRFAEKFTRHSIPVATENEHWLYCVKTGAPLLPAFKKELACAFIKSQYDYQYHLEQVKSRIGQLSDDGDWWTDKYTGWSICAGDFDTEEGFDDGFKVVSRGVLEEDAGNKIMSFAKQPPAQKYVSFETIMINNIVNALSVSMGITIETQKEFIINCVVETINNTVESEADYKEKLKIAAQKGKNLPSYRDFYNTSLLFYTLGAFLIAIQTVIPNIKTRKTHPGCVRSFTGYPFEGQGDLSSLLYISCVAFDIRSSVEPWNVLKKSSVDKVQTRIKAVIDNFLIQMPDVQRKFEEKTQYLLTAPPNDIPEEHDISNWTDFLPPLVPFKMKHLNNITEDFRKKLVNDLRSGANAQKEKILVIESKIVQFSLAIQEKIHAIVKTHKALLHTANNEPYLENSCCDSNENETTHEYFAQKSPEITEYNAIVAKLSNIMKDIKSKTEPAMLLSISNTRNIYPNISTVFDEKTIYLAFIFYCKFKSLLHVPENLLPLCTNKPEPHLINSSDTIERIIQKLKEDGRNYTNQQFLRLVQLISRENIVQIDLHNPIISSVVKLSKLLESIYDENNEDDAFIEPALRNLLYKAIDTFDIARDTTTTEVKDLNNYLIKNNTDMVAEIIDFVQKNSGTSLSRSAIRKFSNTLNFLSVWNYEDSKRNEHTKIANDNVYNITNFNKNYINNFIKVFPNIILNRVDYENANIPIYYGFTKNHTLKLQSQISQYHQKLKPFYGTKTLSNMLSYVQSNGDNLVQLANNTPCFSNIRNGENILKGVINEDTGRYLFQHYLLCSLIGFISLTDRNEMIVQDTRENEDEDEDDDVRRRPLGNHVLSGNKRQLKQHTAELLVAFMDIYKNEREIVDITYEDIQDRNFKLKEREKSMITDKLKGLTDESRDLDTIFKITKQGNYSKGMQKGLTMYDKDFYEEEQNLRDEMLKAERKIRSKNRDATDENIDILLDEHRENMAIDMEIDNEAYDMSNMNESYYDGNTDEVEYDNDD